MSAHAGFLLHHPYALLFGIVLAEQLGIPLPSVPVLLAAGALAGLGKIDAGSALALAVLATVLADLVWFEAGRRRWSLTPA
jgi:membrane protein DedA with SNARE-associated domain